MSLTVKILWTVVGSSPLTWGDFHVIKGNFSEQINFSLSVVITFSLRISNERVLVGVQQKKYILVQSPQRAHWITFLVLLFLFMERETATHSSILVCRIPGTEEHGGLPSVGLHRVGHDWRDLATASVLTLCLNQRLPLTFGPLEFSMKKLIPHITYQSRKALVAQWCPNLCYHMNVAHLDPLSMESSGQECRSR